MKKIVTIKNNEDVKRRFAIIYLTLKMDQYSEDLVEKMTTTFCSTISDIKTKDTLQLLVSHV